MSHVRHFGAVGDGQTDDTEAIRHCIEHGDGLVVFPRGNYRITSTIEVDLSKTGRIAFSGDGGVATLIMDAAGPAIRFVGTHNGSADPKSFKPGVWETERFPTVTQLEIVGAKDGAIGIQLDGTMQATVSGVVIRQCLYGIHLVRRNRNFLLADSHIYHGRGPAIGVYFDGVNIHQANIVGSHISYQAHAGIKVQRSEIRNLQITGCDIEYNYDPEAEDCADVWIDSRESTVREGTITSCTIQAKKSPGGVNVRIEGAPDDHSRTAGLWTITGNILQSQSTNLLLRSCRGVIVTGNSFASAFDRSIVVDKCRNIAIGTNTIDYNPDYSGDRIDGIVVKDSSGCSINGVIVESARAGSPEEGGAIHVARSSEITITGCQVFDSEVRGIHLDEVKNSFVSGCTIHARKPESKHHEAIFARACKTDVVIQGNLLGRGPRGDIFVQGGEPTMHSNLPCA